MTTLATTRVIGTEERWECYHALTVLLVFTRGPLTIGFAVRLVGN